MSSPAPIPTSGAVFLSYAREDAAAARRIADALRAFGVEVWFDKHELRGGDPWDAKIRQQVRECTLFIPVISAATESRSEGYFRREWKLAADRTADMGKRAAFIVPVAIDSTVEGGADVPDEFLRVQWTRLPNGVPSPAFVEQIKRLLEPSRKPVEAARYGPVLVGAATASDPRGKGSEAGDGVASVVRQANRVPLMILSAVGVLAAITVVVWFGASKAPSVSGAPTPAGAESAPRAATPPPAPAADAKSIAVLPFENLSTERENEVFASGMHDDVITALTKIHGLRVISRTSVMLYKPGTRNLRQIANELGVTSVLEGSVRRSGQEVRVNVQLIDARTDAHLWAESYTEELRDFFALQSKLATAITAALQVQLSPAEKLLLARRETTNPQAYALYQGARELMQRDHGQRERSEYEKGINLLGEAVRQDSTFLSAFVLLSRAHGLMNWFGHLDPSASRRAAARAALEAAQRIGPNEPQTRLAAGMYYYLCENDWERALVELRAAEAGLPNDADVHSYMGLALRRLGRVQEALASIMVAVALNPRDAGNPSYHTSILLNLRRYQEAAEFSRRYVVRFPESGPVRRHLVHAELALTGDAQKYLTALESIVESGDLTGEVRRYQVACLRRDYAGAARILEQPGFPGVPDNQDVTIEPVELHRAYLSFLQGDRTAARVAAEQAVEIYARRTWTTRQQPWANIGLATAHALAGRADAATRLALEAMALQAKHDQWSLAAMRLPLARLYGILGRPEEMLDCLRHMMTNSGFHGPTDMRLDPVWDPVRSDPRFEQYLKLARPL